jgi:tetratricopeptide (TPR) repeat protein
MAGGAGNALSGYEKGIEDEETAERWRDRDLGPGHIASGPLEPQGLHHLGMLHYRMGEADAALDLMHKAVEASPEYAEAYSDMGVLLSGRGMLEEAIDCYQFAILIRPDYREAYHNLGGAFAERGEPDKATACYNQALRLGRSGG